MGQKINPIGVRLGIRKGFRSHWYAKGRGYAFFLKEDRYIRDYIVQNYEMCLISIIEIDRRAISMRIRVSAFQVQTLVGINYALLEKFRQNLQRRCHRFRRGYFRLFGFSRYNTKVKIAKSPEIQVFVRQLDSPESDAQYVAGFIVTELEKRSPFRRVLRTVYERVKNSDQVGGLRLQISGRLNGAEIARSEWIRTGRVPLHTFSANLDYSHKNARTIYGLLGVKVWVFCNLYRIE